MGDWVGFNRVIGVESGGCGGGRLPASLRLCVYARCIYFVSAREAYLNWEPCGSRESCREVAMGGYRTRELSPDREC